MCSKYTKYQLAEFFLVLITLHSGVNCSVHDARFGVFDRNADMFHSLKNILNPYAMPRIFMESRRELFSESKFDSDAFLQTGALNSTSMDVSSKEISSPENPRHELNQTATGKENENDEVAVNLNSTEIIRKIRVWYEDVTQTISQRIKESDNPLIIKTIILMLMSLFALIFAYLATLVIGKYGSLMREKLFSTYTTIFRKKELKSDASESGKERHDHSKEFDVNLLNQTFDQYDRLLRVNSHVDSNTGNKSKNSSFAKSEEEVVDLHKFMKDLGLSEESTDAAAKEKHFIVNFKNIDLLGEEIIAGGN